MIKKIIREHFPFILYFGVANSFLKYFKNYTAHSSIANDNSKDKLIGRIIADYHVIEKGLTMDETRLGFGSARLIQLINLCSRYIQKYDNNDEQLIHALGVISEYYDLHKKNNFSLDLDLEQKINKILNSNEIIKSAKQKEFSEEEYFAESDSSFDKFSKTRLSARNYCDKDIPIQELEKAIELSNSTPSSCNRQATKVHVYTDNVVIKKILELQGGNRGFGHLSNKLIVITSELATRHGVYEMTGPFVDGGFYAMNLLYSLHHLKIGACPLNCNFSPEKERLMRKICGIPNSEVFVVMISCGYLSGNFKVPFSKRYSSKHMTTLH